MVMGRLTGRSFWGFVCSEVECWNGGFGVEGFGYEAWRWGGAMIGEWSCVKGLLMCLIEEHFFHLISKEENI